VVIHLVSVLIKTAKGIDLIVPAVRDRGVNKAGGAIAKCTSDSGAISISHTSVLQRRVGHDIRVVRVRRSWRAVGSQATEGSASSHGGRRRKRMWLNKGRSRSNRRRAKYRGTRPRGGRSHGFAR
jgi:hypothetical protein